MMIKLTQMYRVGKTEMLIINKKVVNVEFYFINVSSK